MSLHRHLHRYLPRLRTLGPALVALLLLPAVLTWLAQRPGLEQLDLLAYDRALPLVAQTPSSDILVVAIDETSLAALGQWPWSRATHAELLERLAGAGARSVMLDLLLMEPGDYAADDRRLARAMAELPVYLPLQANRAPQPHAGQDDFFAPLPLLKERARGVGHVELLLDADGIARSLFMRIGPPGNDEPYIGLQIAGVGPPHSSATSDGAGWRYADPLRIPFAGPQGSYRTVSYVHVLRGEVAPEFLRDKIVLVGSTTPGLGDQVVAPIAGHTEPLAGVEVHANVIDQLMHKRSIQSPGWAGIYAWIALPLWLAAWFLRRREGMDLAIVSAVAITWVLGSMASLRVLHWWLAPATPLVGLLVLYLAWSWQRQRSQLRYLQQRAGQLQALPSGAFELPSSEVQRQPPHASPSNRALDHAIARMVDLQVLADSTIQAMPVGVLLCDAQGRIVGSNDAARELLPELAPSAARQDLIALLQPLQPQSRALAQVSGTPPAWIGQIHAEYLTKHQRHVQLLVASVAPHATQAPSGYLVALADLTTERRAQRQREQWHRFLSHDLRNPQANILALIDLEALDTGADASPLAAAVRREALRTLELAETFLDVSHAWTGNYRFAPAHLGALMLDVHDQVLAYANRKQVALVLRVSEHDEEIELNADAALLARALVNLLNNAIRHSPAGKTVQLCLGVDAREVTIAVADEGEGMREDALQRLLSAPHEASVGRSSGETDEPGVRSHGLGFEFVRTVVARHGGTVDGHAAPGFGATFCITLPRER
ncbi:CHASE2 domain-containing protein [Variovorax sp. IB41]|uniref:CHASE2 domain-containing protein n=1 Tax=Variovorax sp. IB41 TaxID=2779370 RepID=UPI0018E8068B|nr:CHASE2 domain-containing protein [Variovorax sp. IB41]MBJ2160219.1 CHASE2 domain-containing protein [Variovorax sp. IB41]